MSKEYVDLLREMYWRRTLEEFGESLHPEAEFHQASVIPDTDDYYGRQEVLRGIQRWLDEWETFRYIPEDLTDLGERVFMRVRLTGRAKASGIALEQRIFHLWEFRDGMPWRCDVFFDEEQALEAAGLRK
jgi:ketosteroid isomerase-like protein